MGYVSDFARDGRVALRRLARTPGWTAMAALALGAAMGINLALFPILGGLILNPLPFPQSGRLLWMQPQHRSGAGTSPLGYSAPDFLDYRAASGGFAALAAYYPNSATLGGSGPAERIVYTNVSAGFFEVLGVAPRMGRAIGAGDELPQLPETAVLGDSLWRRRYGGDPGIVGRTILLENRPVTVVGVMPPGFGYPAVSGRASELWMAEPFGNPILRARRARFLAVIGRLRPGASAAAAQAGMDAISRDLAARYPLEDGNFQTRALPLADYLDGAARRELWSLMGGAGLVLLLACANLASLTLTRAAERGREMAVRASLGATRVRLGRQLLAESFWIAGLGGAAGAGFALLARGALGGLLPAALPPSAAAPGIAAPLFLAAMVLIAGVLAGLAPLAHLLGGDAGRQLGASGLATASPRLRRYQNVLATGEIALATMVLMAAGALASHWMALQRVQPGFDASQLLTFRVSVAASTVEEMRAGREFFSVLNGRLRQLPGVAAAGMVADLPLSGERTNVSFTVAGRVPVEAGRHPETRLQRILPGYLEAMRVPLLQGRTITPDDTAASPPVAVIDTVLARSFFGGANPVGQRLILDFNRPFPVEIVGEAGAVRQRRLDEAPDGEIYVPFLQEPASDMTAVLRVAGPPRAFLPQAAAAVAGLDASIPVYDAATMDERVQQATALERWRTLLFLAISGLALLLAAAGVYGTLAHTVAARRRELAIRMALGAGLAQVRGLIVRQALAMAACGVLAGGVCGALLCRLAASRGLVPAPGAGAAAIWAVIAVALLALALGASWPPLRRASRIAPAAVLREPG